MTARHRQAIPRPAFPRETDERAAGGTRRTTDEALARSGRCNYAFRSRHGWTAMNENGHEFLRVGTLAELQAKGRMVLRGHRHRPVLVVCDQGRIRAFDNRCPHMGFPLDRGTIEDGILTCHWHHARFDLASGCTFDLWADDVPTCPVELRDDEVWVRPVFDRADPVRHWRRRLADGLAHELDLVIAKAVRGLLASGEPPSSVLRQAALFGTHHRDAWGVGLTILTALGNLVPGLPEEETCLALFHGDAAGRRRLRRPGTAPRPRPTREHRRPGDAAALAAALDVRAPSRRCRAHPAHRDRRWCRAGGTGRAAARGRHRASLRRRRPRAGLRQQGRGMPRSDRVGARHCGAALADRADGGGARRRGEHGLAAAGGSPRPHRERHGGAAGAGWPRNACAGPGAVMPPSVGPCWPTIRQRCWPP